MSELGHSESSESVVVPEFPEVLQNLMDDLEHWAAANNSDARWDGVKLWSLKIPAIVISASSGWIAQTDSRVGTVAGIAAGICVALDGLFRAGTLRSVHLRAVAEIKECKHDIRARWTAGALRGIKLNELAAKIIEDAEKEKKRIATYLRLAETSLTHEGTGKRAH